MTDAINTTSVLKTIYKNRKKYEPFSLGELARGLRASEKKARVIADKLVTDGVARMHHIYRDQFELTMKGRDCL